MIIHSDKVFTALNPEPESLDIRIENGRIKELGRLTPLPDEQVIDATGSYVYPGLVDAHSHIGLHGYAIGYTGQDYNEYDQVVCPELDAVDAVNPFDHAFALALAGGVTCVGTGPGSSNVLGGTFTAIKTYGTRVDDMIVKHRVAMKCAFGENPKNYHKTSGVTSRMSTAARLREILNQAKEYQMKIKAAMGDIFKRPAYNAKLEALLPVLNGVLPLKAHAHQANDIFTAIRIAKEFGLKLTLEHCTEGHLIAEALGREGYPVAVGPSMSFPGKPETRNKTFATAGILAKAGCRVSIVTDCGVTPQEYLSLAASLAVKAGMDPFDALQAITINPARHLGIEDRVGSLEPGKDADIIFCSGDILDASSAVKRVFIEGREIPLHPDKESVEY